MGGQVGSRGAQKSQQADADPSADSVEKTVTKARDLRHIASEDNEALWEIKHS